MGMILLRSKLTIDAAKKMKFPIKDFFSKCDQIHSFLRILVTFTEKSLKGKLHLLGNVKSLLMTKSDQKFISQSNTRRMYLSSRLNNG